MYCQACWHDIGFLGRRFKKEKENIMFIVLVRKISVTLFKYVIQVPNFAYLILFR